MNTPNNQNSAPSYALNPEVVAYIVRVIGNTLRDATDRTLSENAKAIRCDIVATAIQLYRSIVISDVCSLLLQALEELEELGNETDPMEIIAMIGLKNNEETRQIRNSLANMYEEFQNDKRKSTAP